MAFTVPVTSFAHLMTLRGNLTAAVKDPGNAETIAATTSALVGLALTTVVSAYTTTGKKISLGMTYLGDLQMDIHCS